MSFYSREFESILGCSAEDAARIEVIVRWERPALNSLSRAQLKREPKIAAALLARLRAEAKAHPDGDATRMLAAIDVEARAYA